jgi:putative DNA primase/helicase
LKLFCYAAREHVRPFLDRIGVDPAKWGCRRSVIGVDARNHGPAIEVYFALRYFAVTGERWPTSPDRIALFDQQALDRLARLIPPARSATPSATSTPRTTAGGDTSRSAIAFRRGAAMRRNGKSYEEMVDALSRDPDTADWVREKGRLSGDRELRRIWDRAAPVPELSNEELALDFARRQADALRYVAAWGRWLIWTDGIWRFDETLEAVDRIRALCRDHSSRADNPKLARETASARTVSAVEKLVRTDLAATSDQWDQDRLTILAGKGASAIAVELDTGAERPPRRQDYFTKSAAVSPGDDDCPLWLRFLKKVTAEDQVLQNYLQRVAGYCLSGLIDEHAMFFLWGTGSNGKSVFINTLLGIWGDYAAIAPMETFIDSPTDRHPTELAHLRGARLVVAQETEKGRRWAEAKIKSITGGDRISARFMRQDFFEFSPQFKLMIAGNHKPSLGTADQAMRRRMHLIPFTVTIPAEDRDPKLPDKLREEWPGILRWAIAGYLKWQQSGLAPPDVVRSATDEYLAGEDVLGRWIEECCVLAPGNWQAGDDLWNAWKVWAEHNNERPGSRIQFGKTMSERGYPTTPIKHVRGHNGIALRPEKPAAGPR